MTETAALWIIIIALGLGSFGLRFVFLGLVGDRPLPPWLLRHLRYTAVAILPALVAPMVVWPAGSDGGTLDPARMAAAALAFVVSYWTGNALLAMGVGAGALLLLL